MSEQLPDWELLSWIWNYPRTNIPRVLALLQPYEVQREIFIFRTRRDVRRFVSEIAAGVDAPDPVALLYSSNCKLPTSPTS